MSVGWLEGHGGRRVFYRWVEPERARARVLVVHGYGEHSGKYDPVLEALRAAGFAALAPDHRGHGRTGPIPGHLEHREHVLADLAAAERRLLEIADGPLFVLAHSLGAALALRHLERAPGRFRGAVLNGVALRVPDSIPRPVRLAATVLARVWPTLAVQPFFDPTRSTRDPVAQQALRDDPLGYRGRIRVGTGDQVMRLFAEVRADLGAVRIPVLLTHGGGDARVPVAVAEEVLAGLGSTDKELRVWPGLLHETWQEPERAEVVGEWVRWMAARAG